MSKNSFGYKSVRTARHALAGEILAEFGGDIYCWDNIERRPEKWFIIIEGHRRHWVMDGAIRADWTLGRCPRERKGRLHRSQTPVNSFLEYIIFQMLLSGVSTTQAHSTCGRYAWTLTKTKKSSQIHLELPLEGYKSARHLSREREGLGGAGVVVINKNYDPRIGFGQRLFLYLPRKESMISEGDNRDKFEKEFNLDSLTVNGRFWPHPLPHVRAHSGGCRARRDVSERASELHKGDLRSVRRTPQRTGTGPTQERPRPL